MFVERSRKGIYERECDYPSDVFIYEQADIFLWQNVPDGSFTLGVLKNQYPNSAAMRTIIAAIIPGMLSVRTFS